MKKFAPGMQIKYPGMQKLCAANVRFLWTGDLDKELEDLKESLSRALTMVRFVGKGHLNDQNIFYVPNLVRHLSKKSDISQKVRYFTIFL